MKKLDQLVWQKASDVIADTVRLEALDSDRRIIFEFSLDPSGKAQLVFFDDCVGKAITLSLLKKLIADAEQKLVEWNDN